MFTDLMRSMRAAALAIGSVVLLGVIVFAIGTYSALAAILFLFFTFITAVHFGLTH